ncbi:MAG: hypothetical protein EZS28_024496 [Streblomastix strix]|uniref:Right handed beta helix domain-containing protein n=1 Tax=Streblomastix strix TaxID=222440 RepID=A0A5J4VC86_9EUKA|nr:MAG: hypothetical protein EZS28_024496 [Streblomastix strix]
MIQPSYQLIYVNNNINTSLTMKQCIFYSLTNKYKDWMFHICIYQIEKVEISDCNFIGIGTKEISNIVMFVINNFSQLILNRCKFENISTESYYDPVQINVDGQDSTIIIKDCEFTNIICDCESGVNALQIYCAQQLRAEISGNKFTNCKSNTSEAGAFQVFDVSDIDIHNEYIINNNTFGANKGTYSGAIAFETYNSNSSFSFANNKFISNKNNNSIGQDVYLNFDNVSDRWPIDNVTEIIKSMFVGSTSDIKKDSVYFEVWYVQFKYFNGTISLPKKSNNEININKEMIKRKKFDISSNENKSNQLRMREQQETK